MITNGFGRVYMVFLVPVGRLLPEHSGPISARFG
jgi:hypothetical protein